jgi:pyrrolidone-carboxylate peptidase
MKYLAKRLILTTLLFSGLTFATEQDPTELTVEEQRIPTAYTAMPSQLKELHERVELFSHHLQQARNYTALMQLMLRHGKALWQEAAVAFANQQSFDDRPLYWARLQMTKALRQASAFRELLPDQQRKLLWQFELLSRGLGDVKYDKNATKKILITGFDPFFLDKHIDQSNPSGVVALALDDLSMNVDGVTVEIETVIVPVRFADFDQGMIEHILSTVMQSQSFDMLFTVSMGRSDFDLEHFPGLRRSAKAPDNLNVYTGADAKHPVKPMLNGKTFVGPEFIRFSLPYQTMMQVQAPYKVHDNREVQTLTKTFSPQSIAELNGEISVQGSGGGYLSNEISYRSLVWRDKFVPLLPAGHIHTPRVAGFDKQKNMAIVNQIKAMISMAVIAPKN